MLEEIKIDLKDGIKYLVKLFREVRRKKKMLFSLCFTLVSGYILFNFSEHILVLLIFIVSTSLLLFNILCFLDSKLSIIINKFRH